MVRCTLSPSVFCELSELGEIQLMIFCFDVFPHLAEFRQNRKWMLASAMSFGTFGDRNIWQSSHDDFTSCDRANYGFSSKLIEDHWDKMRWKQWKNETKKHLQNENQFGDRSFWHFNVLSWWHRRQVYGVQSDRMLFGNCQNYACYSRSDFCRNHRGERKWMLATAMNMKHIEITNVPTDAQCNFTSGDIVVSFFSLQLQKVIISILLFFTYK
jgi:hypothetical protein